MKRRGLLAAGLLGLTALMATADPVAADTDSGPRLVVLDTLPGGSGEVRALGRPGLAAGSSDRVPVYWTGRTVHRIPFPLDLGNGEGEVEAVNQHGLMVGTMRPWSGPDFGFSYKPGWPVARVLPESAFATDVNDHGQIVGGNWHEGFVWRGTRVERRLLPPSPFGPGIGHVTGINNAGTIIGSSGSTGVVWKAGTTGAAEVLSPTEPPEGVFHVPAAIDEHGRIVGATTNFFSDSAYETYWDPPYDADGVEVPGLPGYSSEGYFLAISPSTGLVAGSAPTSFGSPPDFPPGTAEFWTGSGPIRALPRLADDENSDAGAYAAADNGTVGGYSFVDGVSKPVLWTCVH
ncbi:hypothetical protein [Actinacidiphila sp. bgisy160]|uniref:hypothetical protein n=1 Tax=Actinacidiphila sp. bgisy160 TaxID=3413796 RepID=UPI003D75B4CE